MLPAVRPRTVATLLAVSSAVAIVAGCTSTVTVTGSGSAPASEASTAGPFGERPANLSLDGFDPCATVTPEQARVLGLGPARPVPTTQPDIRTCLWNGPSGVYQVAALTALTVQDVARASPDPVIRDLEGYPAVETRTIGSKPDDSCDLYIDVGPEQTLHVGFGNTSASRRPREASCAAVADLARVALGTVRLLAGR